MAKNYKELEDKMNDEKDVVKKVENFLEYAQRFRAKIDWRWYIYDQYHRGNHYVQWNRWTKSVETPPQKSREVRVTINFVYAILRSIKNFVTRGKPMFEAMPLKDSDESLGAARTSTKLLHSWWRELKLAKTFKKAVFYGLKYGPGILETGWDAQAKNGQGELFVSAWDPFDIYIDPKATCIEDARFIIKAIKKSVAEIKENPNYNKNKEEIKGEDKMAASVYKESSLLSVYQKDSSDQTDEDLSSTILYECHLKSKEEGTTKIRIISVCEHKLLRDDDSDLQEYSFTLLPIEENPNEIYPDGWIKNIYPLNKIIDRLESQIVRYNNTMLKGKYIADKNAGITTISTEHGEILEKNRGTQVEQMTLKPLPASVNIQVGNFYKYMEIIGASPEALQGRVPSGVRSGRGIEALQAGAANSLQDARENLEAAMAEVGRKLLSIASIKYTTPRLKKETGLRGPKFYKVLSSTSKSKQKGVEKFDPSDEVYVSMTSELAYTKDVQNERLIQLKQLGAIDDRTFLEHLPLGDVETIMDRLMEEKRMEAERAEVIGGGGGIPNRIKKDKPGTLIGRPQVGNAQPNIVKP